MGRATLSSLDIMLQELFTQEIDASLGDFAEGLSVSMFSARTQLKVCPACGYTELARRLRDQDTQLAVHPQGGVGPQVTGLNVGSPSVLLNLLDQQQAGTAPPDCPEPLREATQVEESAFAMGGFDAVKALLVG